MTYQGKSIKCSDCGTIFTFTAGEQEFYAFKGLAVEPALCRTCRTTRKTQRNGDGVYTYRSNPSPN